MPKKESRLTQSKIRNVICLVATAVIMAAIAFTLKAGNDDADALTNIPPTIEKTDSTLTYLPDGTAVVNSAEIGKDELGYGGPVPVKVFFKGGRIDRIEALPNNETPDFFDVLVKSGIFKAWNGKTPAEALAMQVDGVSGATFSSRGFVGNVHKALEYANKNLLETPAPVVKAAPKLDYKLIAALIVALAAATLPLFVKNRKYHIVQKIMNVAVLGFWSGSFLGYSRMLGIFGGVNSLAAIITVILLVTAFIYPLFGKKSYYCLNICPFGSLQDLAGKCSRRKIRLTGRTIKALVWFRRIVWVALIFLLWSEIFTQWINYELFVAFSPAAAAVPVIICAALIVLLSVFVPRPYCRFICPTGTLFKFAQGKW